MHNKSDLRHPTIPFEGDERMLNEIPCWKWREIRRLRRLSVRKWRRAANKRFGCKDKGRTGKHGDVSSSGWRWRLVCTHLDGVSRLQREWAVLPKDGQRAGQHGAQHPRQRYHAEAHILAHPGLQVVHDAPGTNAHTWVWLSARRKWTRSHRWIKDERADDAARSGTVWSAGKKRRRVRALAS